MPKMQNLNHIRILLNSIIDQDRGVDQLTNARFAGNATAQVREAFQHLNVIEKRIAEAFSRLRKLVPRILQEVLELS